MDVVFLKVDVDKVPVTPALTSVRPLRITDRCEGPKDLSNAHVPVFQVRRADCIVHGCRQKCVECWSFFHDSSFSFNRSMY